MAETLDLLGVIGTWAAALLAIIALAGIIPAYLLYRESQTDHYEALSLVDDKPHEYISEGYALLPGKRFFRSVKVPNLLEPPILALEAPNTKQLIVKRECDLLDRCGSPSLTSWINFANLLKAYEIYPPKDGKLKFAGDEALLPIHRSWVLLLGLIDRYGRRDDSGLFVDELPELEWSTFGNEALYGLSGILERMHSGRDRICFRMHSVAHMKNMPTYVPTKDISLRNLFFLYLGYLPAPDGSLYCSAVESDGSNSSGKSPSVHRTTKESMNVFYKMKMLEANEVPSRDRRLAEEMGIRLPQIRRLSLYKSFPIPLDGRPPVNPDHNRGFLDDVQHFTLGQGAEIAIWLQPSETRSMILALLQLDLNAQSFLCDSNLKEFFERLLPPRDMGYLLRMAEEGIDTLQIGDADKEQLRTAIGEVTDHQESVAKGRQWASSLAKLDRNLQSLRQKYKVTKAAMETMAILYLTQDEFQSRMAVDPRHIDSQAIFSIDITQKKVYLPAISYFPSVEFDFDFAAIFLITEGEKRESGGSLTLPLWQAMLASLHGTVKWQMWSTVFSARDLSVFHAQLNRTVYVSAHDLPQHEEDLGERLQDIADACRSFTSFVRRSQKSSSGKKRRRRVRHEEEGEDDDDWDEENNEYDNDDGSQNDAWEREYEVDIEGNIGVPDRGVPEKESIRSEALLPPRGRENGVEFAGVDTYQDSHSQDRSFSSDKVNLLLEIPNLDALVAVDTLVFRSDHEKGENQSRNRPVQASVAASTAGGVALTREQREERYLPGLGQLLASHSEDEDATLTGEFRKVIGPIVLMAESLPARSFEILLGISPEIILRQLDQLQSAVAEPVVSAEPIELVDVSFRDFILDADLRGTNRFWVDEIETHRTMAMKCLELISQPGILRENVCSLERPGQLRSDINRQQIDDALPSHVQYACRYWVDHFEKGKCSVSDDGQVIDFLKGHFLHWLEALSLMGCISESIAMVNALRSLAASDSRQVSLFLQDAWRFLLRNRPVIDEAPLQLYSSAIVFLPKSSVVRSTFLKQITKPVCQVPDVNPTWDNVLISLEKTDASAQSRWTYSGPQALAFSPDGKLLVAGTITEAIIWSPVTGALLRTVKERGVRAVAFSPDSSLLALGVYHGFVSVHNLKTRTRSGRFKACSAFDGEVNSIVFSSGGNLLAAGASDGTITLWDVTKEALIHRFRGHSENVGTLALSSEGLLASGSGDQTARVWEVVSGKLRLTFKQFSTAVRTVGFVPDGSLLMASYDGRVQIWDPKDGAHVRTLIAADHDEHEWSGASSNPILLSPNGKVLAMTNHGTVALHDATSGEKKMVVQGSLEYPSALAFSPKGTMLAATNSTESRVEIWELPEEETPDSSHNDTHCGTQMLGLAPNGKIFVSADWGTFSLWDSTTGTVVRTYHLARLDIKEFAFSPDSGMLAFLSWESLNIWDIVGEKIVQTMRPSHPGELTFSQDCKTITVSAFQEIELWDITTGSLQQRFQTLELFDVAHIEFSSDGSFLAAGLFTGMIQRWSLDTGAPLPTLTGHTKPVVRVAFSSDSKILASASTDATIRLWDWTTGTALQTFHADTDITKLSFCDNDRRLETNVEVFALADSADREALKILSYPRFELNGNWITRNDENFLWLPPGYRARRLRCRGKFIALELEREGIAFVVIDS